MEVDFFDPQTWEPEPDFKRVWLCPDRGIFCVVDAIDFAWALQWSWSATPDKAGKKFYATRSTRLYGREGPQTRVYMHKAILERTGVAPASAKHTIGDHEDGDSLNNRRSNIVWSTVSENNKNLFGIRARQRQLAV